MKALGGLELGQFMTGCLQLVTVLEKLFLLSLGSCVLFPQQSESQSEAEGLFCPKGTCLEGED